MLEELKMPEGGMGITEGTIAKWHKAEGDAIHPGELLAEIETAKAITELTSPIEGTLERIVCAAGVTAEVNATVALVRKSV